MPQQFHRKLPDRLYHDGVQNGSILTPLPPDSVTVLVCVGQCSTVSQGGLILSYHAALWQ
jgi:hypothetical protein